MGEINYAEKYSNEIDERFSLASVTEKAINKNFDFDGVNKVFIYSAETAEVNDYSMVGTNRYGTPAELGNRVQELKLTQDKSFTFTIDRRNNTDTMMTQHAGRCLQRQIDEVIIPMMDKYRLEKLAEAAEQICESTLKWGSREWAGKSVYYDILEIGAQMTNKKVPTSGRIIFMTPEAYIDLKCSKEYRGCADVAASIAQTGNAPMVDGMTIQVVPKDYLPPKTIFLITHPCAMCSPVKLAEYNVHDNPPGISGWLIEGRTYYDAFVFNNKKDAIALVIDDQITDETDDQDNGGEAVSDQGEVTAAEVGSLALEEMTVQQLKDYAVNNGIDLGDARTKAEIVAAIHAAEADTGQLCYGIR